MSTCPIEGLIGDVSLNGTYIMLLTGVTLNATRDVTEFSAMGTYETSCLLPGRVRYAGNFDKGFACESYFDIFRDNPTTGGAQFAGSKAIRVGYTSNAGIGVVYQAMDSLTLSADYFYVKLENIVNTPSNQFILDVNATDGSFASAIVAYTSERASCAASCVIPLAAVSSSRRKLGLPSSRSGQLMPCGRRA